MALTDQYALNWSNHTNHIRKAFDCLFAEREFVDVTLSCEGKKVGAHRMLLSACSAYFHDLFRDNPCQHPIVILKDVKFQILLDILKFMYSGEVSIATETFDSFLKTAELLQVSGLTEDEKQGAAETVKTKTKKTNAAPAEQAKTVTPKPTNNEEPETTKRRATESTASEEITPKKRKEADLKEDVEIKEELISLEEGQLMQDPLEFEQHDSFESVDILQPTGSQQFADDLLDESKNQLKSQSILNKETQCSICNKRFSHPLSLRHHTAVHLGITQCPICNAVLSRKYELKLHMRARHNVEKP